MNQEKPKLLIVTSEFPPGPGGIGNHAYCLARILVKNEWPVTVLSEERSAFLGESVELEGVRVEYLERKSTYLGRILTRYCTMKRMGREADIVITSGFWPSAYAGFLPKSSRRKVIAVGHGIDISPTNRIGLALIRRALRQADKVIAVSNYTRSRMPSCAKSNCIVINNGYEPKSGHVTPSGPDEDGRINLLTVGNVSIRKGQENVIKALPSILGRFPQAHYHMVGIPSERDKLRTLASSLGVRGHVTFHGVLDNARLTDMLTMADVFVMLSQNTVEGDFEGFGIAIIEGNHVGLPAIGAKRSGIEDAIADRDSGRLVERDKPEMIADALTEIIDDWQNYSARARSHCKKFEWGHIVKSYEDVLIEIAGK